MYAYINKFGGDGEDDERELQQFTEEIKITNYQK